MYRQLEPQFLLAASPLQVALSASSYPHLTDVIGVIPLEFPLLLAATPLQGAMSASVYPRFQALTGLVPIRLLNSLAANPIARQLTFCKKVL